MGIYTSADIISIIGQGLLVWMDPTKADRTGGGRKCFNIGQTASGCLGQHVGGGGCRTWKSSYI